MVAVTTNIYGGEARELANALGFKTHKQVISGQAKVKFTYRNVEGRSVITMEVETI